MANLTLKGNPVQTIGELPKVGSKAPDFSLTKTDLTPVSLNDFKGKKVVLNIFPSVDTGTCAASVRAFNQAISTRSNAVVLCVSKDLPFAFSRFCGAEGIENVICASDFRSQSFGSDYGVQFTSGPLEGLLSRAVLVLDENGVVQYGEQVNEIVDEPNYEAALSTL